MARLQLNKSSLAKQSKDLQSYTRYLPSLDLKRQQLMMEKAKVTRLKSQLTTELEGLLFSVKTELPMLANIEIALDDLLAPPVIELAHENVVGVTLPCIKKIEHQPSKYEMLAKPHWVDYYVELMTNALGLQIKIDLQKQREQLLEKAIKTITQRVNLFEKVLIPQAKSNIKRIRIYLSDEQMSSVVRSKIAKHKRKTKHQVELS